MSEIKKPSNLQIFLFFIGFVTLFTLVFVLGIVVGKGLSTRGEVEVAELTEHESKEPAQDSESRDDQVAVNDVNSQKDAQEENTREEAVEAKTDTNSSSKETEVAKKDTVKKEEVAKADKKAANENQLGYQKKSVNPTPVGNIFPPTDPGGKFTVQIGSFKEKAGAERILNTYRSKGYPAKINTATTDENETWYRVSIGTFSKRDTAKKYFEVLKQKEKDISGFITVNQ